MSLTSNILSLNSALQSFTYGESVIAQNIANVNTPGYTSEVTNLESLPNLGGVTIAGVGSTRNSFLYNQIYGQLALQNFTSAQLSAMNQLSAILPEVANPAATNGLNAAINNLSTAWKALSAAPASTADETAVLTDMQTLAGLFNTDSNQLYILQQNVNTQIQGAVTQVNSLEDQILSLNQQIVSLGGQQSAQTSTLIDQREVDAEALTGLTGANVNYDTNGAMVVTFNGGTLVDGVTTYHLGLMNSKTTPGLTDIGYVGSPNATQMADVTSDFVSGTLGGLLYSNNTQISQAISTINKMASGIINFSNEVNESGPAPDGSFNQLFNGTNASDISVNPALINNPAYVIASSDPANPGNLATVQAAMTTLNMYSEIETDNPNFLAGGIELIAGAPINPTLSLASQSGLFANPPPNAGGTLVISAGGNTVNVAWNNGQSLDTIIANINAAGGGGIYATLQTNPAGQFVHIYADGPISMYDNGGNLINALQLSAVLVSSAPINAVPTSGVNQVVDTNPLNFVAAPANPNGINNPLALFTQPIVPPTGGLVEVDGNPALTFAWNPAQSLNAIGAAIAAAAPATTTLTATFNPATQQMILSDTPNGAVGAGNQLQSISFDDLRGNLTQVLNLNSDTNATKLFSQLTTTVNNNTAALKAENTQAGNLVTATQNLQNAQSKVNLGVQFGEAMVYQNAYDAAVRLQYVMESMLNYLITQVGSPVSGSRASA